VRTLTTFFTITILILATLSLGCQGDPALPGIDPALNPGPEGYSAAGPVHQCFGFFTITADTASGEFDIVPLRSSQWHFNITSILNKTMGIGAAGVPAEADPAHGLFVLDISLTHPFATKPQFSGFDVKGILVTPGTLAIGNDTFADLDEIRLLNSDGYTRWWNPSEFPLSGMLGYTQGVLATAPAGLLTATVNPYKAYADLLDAESDVSTLAGETLDSDTGRAVFTAGSSNTRRYRIRFPMNPGPQAIFGYAIDVAWNTPSPNPPLQIPDDFPIEANQPEAFYIEIDPYQSSLYYDDEAASGGGMLALNIHISDWQGISSGDLQSEIASVAVAAPDLFDGYQSATYVSEDSTRATFGIDLTAYAVPTHSGDNMIVARIVSSDGSTFKQTGAPGPSEALKAYQVYLLDIPDPDCVSDDNNSFGQAVTIQNHELISDQVCLPQDASDFYTFDIPIGNSVSGQIDLECDTSGTTLGLYSSIETLIAEEPISSGAASINLEPFDLTPGFYYIKLNTTSSSQVAVYWLELDLELTNIAPSNPFEVTPSTLVVKPNRIWTHNQVAYMTSELGCWVYDVSGSSAPSEISYRPFNIPPQAAFSHPYLYFKERLGTSESRVNMIDFTDPASPTLHENVIHFDYVISTFAINDNNLYLAIRTTTTDSEIQIYDYLTDPLAPSLLGSTTTSYVIDQMEILEKDSFDTHLAIGSVQSVHTFNVENPSTLVTAGTYTLTDGYIKDIACMGGQLGDHFVMACDVDYDGDGFIYIMQQTATPSVEKISELDMPGSAENVLVAGDYVFVGDGPAGLSSVNVNVPASPVYLTSLPTKSDAHDLDLSGFICCLIPLDAGLQLINVTDPSTPAALYDLKVANSPTSLEIIDSSELLMSEKAGTHYAVKVIDIDIPENASVTYEYIVPEAPNHIFLDGDRLAVNQDESVLVLDVSDTSAITQVSEIITGMGVASLAMQGDAVYIGAYPDDILVYDISNPGSPSLSAALDTDDYCLDFTFHSGYMYACVGNDIRIYSLANPLIPSPETPYNVTNGTKDTVVIDDLLYLVTAHYLYIFDVSDPVNLTPFGSAVIEPLQWLSDIAIEGYFAYVLGESTAPLACSIWPADSPDLYAPIYGHDPYGCNFDLLVLDGFLYESSAESGLRIHDLY